MDNDTFNAIYKNSPFETKHCNINFIGVFAGDQLVSHNPLRPNVRKNHYIRIDKILFTNADNKDLYLSRSEFSQGYSLFCFDLSPDLCDSADLNLSRHSNLRLEIKFATPLDEAISVLVYAEFENLLVINKARNIFYDFGNC